MAQLSIPDQYRRGFAELLKLNEDQVRELISAFKEVQPVRSLRSLYASVLSNVESIEHSELDEIVDTIVSLFALRDNLGEPTPEFVEIITRIVDHSEFDDLAFSDDESRGSFEAVLTEILEIDSLEKAAKAIGLVYDQDHIVHGSPRIITDIRPIFSSAPADVSIRAAMVTYTLKLDYHKGQRVMELFLALNAGQVDELIEALERAKSKAESIKELIGGSDIEYVEAE